MLPRNQSQKHEIQNKKKLYVELATKFFVYFAVGFNILFVAPIVFRVMGCERATFHTEVLILKYTKILNLCMDHVISTEH